MPFTAAFGDQRLVERIRDLRHNPFAGYGIALAAVALATLARWTVGEYILPGLPFATFYPAVIVATLIGGVWPGILSIVLSSLAGWFLFLAPTYDWPLAWREILTMLFFVILAGMSAALVAMLNAAVDHALAQENNMRTVIESSPNGIVVVDDKGRIRLINAGMEKLFGYSRTELLGREIEALVPEPAVFRHHALRDAFLKNPQTRAMGAGRDLNGRRKDGSEFPVEIGLTSVKRNGRIRVLVTIIDISERKRAQDWQRLMVRELEHRTRNLFSVIQAIANRSLSDDGTVAEAKMDFTGRLHALARTHLMLAESAWEGVPLSEILEREFDGFTSRPTVSGCDIILNANAAQTFALIVHELATNAIKYGALSVPDGRIAIEGIVAPDRGDRTFSFRWRESGGPLVITPARKGFGSTILLDATREFGRNVALNYMSQGVSYELEVLLSNIEASNKFADNERAAPAEPRANSS